MRCFGRTIKAKRCQNSSRFLFCRHHKLQPIFLIIALGAGAIYIDDLFNSLGFNKPITYINSLFVFDPIENYNCDTFNDTSTTRKLNVLLMPFGTKSSCKIQDNKYHHSLRDRFHELDSTFQLVNICTIDSVYCEYTDDQMINIAKQLNANLIIWGNYIEYCEWDTTLINIKYAFSDNDFKISEDSSINSIRKYNTAKFLESGKLTGSIEDIIFYSFAINEFRNGNYTEAIKLAKKVTIRPNYQVGQPLFLAGVSYLLLKDFKNAVVLLDLSSKFDCNHCYPEIIYFMKGEANRYLYNYSEALIDYTQSIQYNPDYIDAFLGRANIYKALNMYEYILQDARCAFEIDSTNEKAIMLLSEYYYFYEDFCKSYFYILKLDMDTSIQYNLQLSKARCFQQVGALKLSKIEYESLVFNYIDSFAPKALLGAIYLQQNDTIGFSNFMLNTLFNFPRDTQFKKFFFTIQMNNLKKNPIILEKIRTD